MEKQTTDLLNVIKTGHSGSIAGNPAHALDDKTMNAIIQNCTTTIVLGKTGKGKKTLMKSCLRTKLDRILVSDC
ncbi:TPA: hypothetical protein ACPVKL_004385 [Escherichia coli]|jgi:Flp pilus assembly CpaF family ATPase|uniref:hypothetical protein n=1 Tax=Escherichia coli TaxID=562 RepID=UPI0003EE0C7F|nr:hypothetical protein [Escherichia coli]EAT1242708.1 hypothetical protein [Salmonella enterica]EBX0425192.1 hypothetical protein [Salmonella enterica subsp. enterica serovar Enteritidis]ECT9537443.1 hypothetical protein [Salmonella enterica subsp. enterica serovar Typhimurium]EEI3452788.1 hypothetical protein [Salmonella enterica subsp. enterica serovar Infantis]EFV6752670.1 hypothetical protein [Shigella flexneri]EGE0740079.1 hypothetical protein [Shigella dysenteriae]EIC2557062.1 hypothe